MVNDSNKTDSELEDERNAQYALYTGKRKLYIGFIIVFQLIFLKPIDALLGLIFFTNGPSPLPHWQIFLFVNAIVIFVCWRHYERKIKSLGQITKPNTGEDDINPGYFREGFVTGSVWGILTHLPIFLFGHIDYNSSSFASILSQISLWGWIVLPFVDFLFLISIIFSDKENRAFILGFIITGIVSMILCFGACSQLLSEI